MRILAAVRLVIEPKMWRRKSPSALMVMFGPEKRATCADNFALQIRNGTEGSNPLRSATESRLCGFSGSNRRNRPVCGFNPGQDVPCGRGRGDYRVGLSATCGWDFQKGLAASLTHGESWLKVEAGGEGVSYGHAA